MYGTRYNSSIFRYEYEYEYCNDHENELKAIVVRSAHMVYDARNSST